MSGAPLLPWRFLVPRKGYFKGLKIADECPEIRTHIDRIAIYSLGCMILKVALFGAFVAIYPLIRIADKAKRLLAALPDFEGKRVEAIREAHEIVPPEEIRMRIGLPPERGTLLRKKRVHKDA